MTLQPEKFVHIPVLLEEVIAALQVQPGGRYIDCTLGAGGHAAAILDRSSPGGQLLGFDADPEALKAAKARLEAYGDSALLFNENFTNLEAVCVKHDFAPVHGILFDLGMSSLQLNGSGRGFSFQHDAPLDMRFDPDASLSAEEIVNAWPEEQLADVIFRFGEERKSRRIARAIVQARPLASTKELANVARALNGTTGWSPTRFTCGSSEALPTNPSPSPSARGRLRLLRTTTPRRGFG